MDAETNGDRINHHAFLIADIIQDATGCSTSTAYDLKEALAEFAEEIKRQAIEPEGNHGT